MRWYNAHTTAMEAPALLRYRLRACVLALLAACALRASAAVRTVVDRESRLSVHFVTTGPGIKTTSYPTGHSWHRDGRHIFIESSANRAGIVLGEIQSIDIRTGKARTLVTRTDPVPPFSDPSDPRRTPFFTFDYATGANRLFHFDVRCHSLYLLDPDTGRTECILENDPTTFGAPPSISPDGTRAAYLASVGCATNKYFGGRVCAVFSLRIDPTAMKAVGQPKVVTAYPSRITEGAPGGVVVNHAQVNPVYPNHFIYSHEFPNELASRSPDLTRMWENRDGLDASILRPKPGEWQTHEVIGPFGRKLYFVENWKVCVVDIATRRKRVIYPGKPLRAHHIAVSPDEKWIAADTWDWNAIDSDGDCPGAIFLIEAATGKSKLLCRIRAGSSHPRHPHPNFSPDGRKVAFTVAEGRGSQVAYVELARVTAGRREVSAHWRSPRGAGPCR